MSLEFYGCWLLGFTELRHALNLSDVNQADTDIF